ncbi:MAG: hypothetical protein Kow0069_29510 [Promethearchaeota archaeon]
MDPGERDYYVEVHGFDPVADRLPTEEGFAYEATYSLSNGSDAELDAAGVKIVARVRVEAGGVTRNQIAFRAGDLEKIVHCVHTAVYVGELSEVSDLSAELLADLAQSTENKPIQLTPEEHFASLKSYVAGLAELGLGNAFRWVYGPGGSLDGLGFNSLLLQQVATAIRSLVPEASKRFFTSVAVEIARASPPSWLVENIEFLDRALGLGDVFLDLTMFRRFCSILGAERLRAAAVLQPVVATAVLLDVARDASPETRAKLALRPELPEAVLSALAHDPVLEIRVAAAKHPAATVNSLRHAAYDPDPRVRLAVLDRRAIPVDLAAELESDEDHRVRLRLAGHRSAPLSTIAKMLADPDPEVRVLAATRAAIVPRLERALVRAWDDRLKEATVEKMRGLDRPAKVLAGFTARMASILEALAEDGDALVRAAVAGNPATPKWVLLRLCQDVVVNVRAWLLQNPSCPVGVKRALARRDPDGALRELARSLLQENASGGFI